MSTIYCNECGTANETGSVFCQNCGTPLQETDTPSLFDTVEAEAIQPESYAINENQSIAEENKPESNKKTLSLFITGAVLLLIATLAVVFLKGGKLPGLRGVLPEKEQYIFRISGSNPICEHIMPELITTFLSEKYKSTEISSWKGNKPGETIYSAKYTDSNGNSKTAKILLRSNGSLAGMRQLQSDSAEIIASTVKASESDISDPVLLRSLLSNGNEITLGKTAPVFIVNKNNPLRKLSFEQISSVLKGEVKTWHELNVDIDGDIQLVLPDQNSATLRNLLGNFSIQDKDLFSGIKRLYSQDSISSIVGSNKNTLGLISFGTRFTGNPVALITDLGNVQPSFITITRGEYPISSNAYLYCRREAVSDLVNQFVEFCVSKAPAIVKKSSFAYNSAMLTIPRLNYTEPETPPTDEETITLNSVYKTGRILSFPIYFDATGLQYVTSEVEKINIAGEFLSRAENIGKDIFVVGYGLEQESDELPLSEACKTRATMVAKKLQEYGLSPKVLVGGSGFLLGWPASKGYKYQNNRVEIFVK